MSERKYWNWLGDDPMPEVAERYYDQYITYESKEALRVLTSFTIGDIEAGLAIRKG